jgi:hypothetical protein
MHRPLNNSKNEGAMPNGSHTCKYNNTEKVGDDNVEFGQGESLRKHILISNNYDY